MPNLLAWNSSSDRNKSTRVCAADAYQNGAGVGNLLDIPLIRDAILMQLLLLYASTTAKFPSGRRVVHLEFAADELPSGVRWRDRV
jgi:hypothetical protein